jgi:hypothetical protein
MKRLLRGLATPSIGLTLVIACTFAVYWQVTDHALILLDDHRYVNRALEGLTYESVIWAFTSYEVSNWHPLTWLSHMLDAEIFGMHPGGAHATNLLLHLAGTCLLYLALSRMTRAPWRSLIVSALFALHPLHVEPVAWVAERKDVLSGVFFMLTLWAYARYAERPGSWGRYLPVALFFSLGLMAKAMLVTLPCVLLLLDIWPLRRLRLDRLSSLGRLVIEKLPLFVLALAAGFLTFAAQRAGNALPDLAWLPLHTRILNAALAYVGYLGKAFWPVGLAVYYPHPREALTLGAGLGAVALLVLISSWVLLLGRKRPYLPVGWFWYLGMLAPVIGLVQIGGQAMADRYTYLPLIGLFVAGVWGVHDLAARLRVPAPLFVPLSVALMLALAVSTWLQVGRWRDSETLFKHTLAVTSDNIRIHELLGMHLAGTGRLEEAIAEYSEALRIEPGFNRARFHLGEALARKGDLEAAAAKLQEVLRVEPHDPRANKMLMLVLARLDETEP